MLYKLLIIYLALINLVGFVSMGRDKRSAAARRARTPERRLLAYAWLGGSLGSIFGMAVFRHKTRHLKFRLGLPLILILQLAIIAAAVIYF